MRVSAILRIELLGGFRVCAGAEEPVELPLQQATALLAYLALRPGRAHPREHLAEIFWAEVDPETGRRSLRQALYTLKGLLKQLPTPAGAVLIAGRTSVELDPALVSSDVAELEAALARAGDAKDPSERIRLLSAAVDLYRGELLPGHYHDAFTSPRQRLAEGHILTLHALTRAYEERGPLEQAIRTAQRVLAIDPLVEDAHCDLMRLYAANGQPSAVLRQYRALERVLKEELGELPRESTRRQMEDLRLAVSDATTVSSPSAVHPPTPISALRTQNTARRPEAPAPISPASGAVPEPLARRGLRTLPTAGVLLVLLLILLLGAARLATPKALSPESAGRFPSGGRELWVAPYQGEATDGDSEPTAVTSDAAGNIYLTGFIQTAEHDVDFITLKYGQDGRKLWEARYNGPGNDVDRARSIAVADDGCVYVTGDSDNGRGNGVTRLSGLDYATVKYDPSGKQLWVRRYNGPDNGEDEPVKLLVAPAGGVYVTGRSHGRHGGIERPDYATVRYSASGEQEWARRFDLRAFDDHAVDVVLDATGDLIVTGYAIETERRGPDTDFVTIRYSPAGALRWVRSYNGAYSGDEFARGIGVDRDGNVYVVGQGYNGDRAVGGTEKDYVTVKYDRWGTEKWVRSYSPAGYSEVPHAMVVSPAGQVYVTGELPGANSTPDIVTLGYDAAGNQQWTQRFNGLSSRGDAPGGIALDPAGNVLVAGASFNGMKTAGGSEDDFVTLKYSPAGDLLWLRFYNSPISEGDRATALTTDASGNVLVTGRSRDGHRWTIATVKYSP